MYVTGKVNVTHFMYIFTECLQINIQSSISHEINTFWNGISEMKNQF